MFRALVDVPVMGVRIVKCGSYVIQTATITSRTTRGGPLKLKPPFPYERKKLTALSLILDSTMARLACENAKVIAVEGPIGAGKSAFAQALADEFEMKFIPQPTMDEFYVLSNGYDLRQHDEEFPELIQTYDHKNFCTNPFTFRAAIFQYRMLYLKFHQYIDAMCHLYNSGQGVILERNFNSDYVFMKAMVENNFFDRKFLEPYFTIKKNISTFFPEPHLIIYLDMPVPVVQERIRTRNYSYEQNSPALTPQYLCSLENLIKQDYLKKASQNSEILIYDWSDGGNVDVVIDDIENIDFDIMRADKKFINWRISRKYINIYRELVTNDPFLFDKYFHYPWHEVDEVFEFLKKSRQWCKVFNSLPDVKYDEGWNHLIGDSKFKIFFNLVNKTRKKPSFYFDLED